GQGKRHGHENVQGFLHGVVGHVKHDENDHQYDGNDNLQTLFGTNLVLVLSAPFDVIASRHGHALCDDSLRFLDKPPDVTAPHIHQNGSSQQAVLAGDH